jgi:hypothetical protein
MVLGAGLILLGSVAAGCGLIVLMRRLAGDTAYFRDSSIAGGAFGAVRGPFAVLLAFVVFLAFQGYTRADTAARNEASAVLTLFRTAAQLPPKTANKLEQDLICYSRTVIQDEWPMMEHGEESAVIDHWLFKTEQAIGELAIQTPLQEQVLSEFFAETNIREEARDERLAEADGVVPVPVWIVLILGGLMIVIYVAFFASPRERLLSQFVMMGTTVAVIASGLLLVAFFDQPYSDRPGALEPTAMAATLKRMEVERQAEPFATEPECDSSGRPVAGD